MSREENTTAADETATVERLNGRPYASPDVFQDMDVDYKAGRNVWREVPYQFARYVREVMPPVDGPEGSGSFALGECFDTTRHGAVHCVIAVEDSQYYAKYVNLMRWPEELLALREQLSASAPDICDPDNCRACRRPICTGAKAIKNT
jgi:hypothetical protein